ncbi:MULTISPECIES: hypothetical protein [Halorussus]|uniref:hypothetical protein n=1 Tax=Halorussus TaxID=1070314 RepID=UPI000E212F49|nr:MULTISPECIES: hypothetical protein [Halorussus]NHN59585.1 hypothetical protein [Halorussus sp. JP-T4]
MTELTRRSVLAAAGASLALAGCLTDAPDGSGGEKLTERTTTGSPPTGKPGTETGPGETPAAGETTGDWVERLSNEPEPSHGIAIENEAGVPGTFRVEVVREATGETVFETTRRVRPGGEVAVYNLRQADPEGVERFEVCAELVDAGEAGTGTAEEPTTTSATTTDGSATATGESSTESRSTEAAASTAVETTTADSSRRDCATIATNECYGSAYARFAEDGSVQLVYAIC